MSRSGARAPNGTEPHAPLLPLTVAALGVVYGDIGTSPLYAVREAFSVRYGLDPTPAHVLGILSLVFWALTMVVTVKYIGFIMRADNRGEGGIFALLALVPRAADGGQRVRTVVLLGLAGAALLYGDGAITPAISVLSAVEGLEVAMAAPRPAVVALTIAILVALFLLQRRGTEGIGRIFGPIMLVWFATIAILGATQVVRRPEVLAAANPLYAVELFIESPARAFALLGAVVLVVTGGEALYADMGHFGRRPIRLGWFGLVGPALLLNYFGQGALLLETAAAAANPFYALVPRALLYPMVGLATLATIIASQALISGVFSLTRQAVQLGYCPRVTIVHTSEKAEGQIYVPAVNYGLMVACVWLVLEFQESGRLAAAYGLAVTGSMTITSLVYLVVLTKTWRWPVWRAAVLVGGFLVFDLAFFGASLLKFAQGGWFPVLIGAAIFTVMLTWKDGRALLAARLRETSLPVDRFLADVERRRPPRVSGTAVFLAPTREFTPISLLHHLKHNKVLHEQVVLLSIEPRDVPRVSPEERVGVERLRHGFWRVVATYGFMETPNVPEILARCRRFDLEAEPMATSFYLSRQTLLTGGRSRMMRWRKSLFAFLARNAPPATAYFRIPPNRVVELGMQVEI